jgi:F420-non-reducing hydrogenase iron-sulfur subunit
MGRLGDLLDQIGLGSERIEMINVSAAMAAEFVARAKEMTQRIRALGPSPLRDRGAGAGSVAGADSIEREDSDTEGGA